MASMIWLTATGRASSSMLVNADLVTAVIANAGEGGGSYVYFVGVETGMHFEETLDEIAAQIAGDPIAPDGDLDHN